MLSEQFCERISDDWTWREKELRSVDAQILRAKGDYIAVKSGLLIVYSHWEGHFKTCASELLDFISEGVSRKVFRWTDIKPEIRLRILFCSYRKSSLSGQTHENFVSYLNALNDTRYSRALNAKSEIVMVDDNLNAMRAEAICKNLGVEHSWISLKKIIIDERLLEHRNAFAHGSNFLRSGDRIDFSKSDIADSIDETRQLIREAKNRFTNAISLKSFLI